MVLALLIGVGAGFGIGRATGGTDGPAKASPSASKAAQARTFPVDGTLELTGSENFTDDGDGNCLGTDGYDDISDGAEVVISADSGKTLAITTLQAGQDDQEGDCTFSFSTHVRAGYSFYGVTVSHRGTVKFSRSQVTTAALTLGD